MSYYTSMPHNQHQFQHFVIFDVSVSVWMYVRVYVAQFILERETNSAFGLFLQRLWRNQHAFLALTVCI